MSHQQKIEFVHYSDTFGPLIMKATTWAEVMSELHDIGKVKVVKRTYQWVDDEPQIIYRNY